MSLALIRGLFRLLSFVAPAAASALAIHLFRSPRRHATPPREREVMAGARPFEVRAGASTRLQCWSWEAGTSVRREDAPLVILMHGWEGRGSQMAVFAAPLVKAGFRVVTFDAPAHGASTGRTSSLPHFTWALRAVASSQGTPHAIIAHSMGCASATLALRDGLDVKRLVFVAPPLDPSNYTRQFGEIFRLPESTIAGLRNRVEERFLRPWSDYSPAQSAPHMRARLLVVHDRDDVEVPYEGGATLAALWPHARLMTTQGLGHRRVLRDEAVLRETAAFIAD
jgi:pimeloyl-ACP methyl ester carboxylesterase